MRLAPTLFRMAPLVVAVSAAAYPLLAQSASPSQEPSPTPEIVDATRHIQRNPKDSDAYASRADLYLWSGPPNRNPPFRWARAAQQDLIRALDLNPSNFAARYNYAYVLMLFWDQDGAIVEYTKAIPLASDAEQRARTFAARGVVYLDACRFSEARADFTIARRLLASVDIPDEDVSRRAEQACESRPAAGPAGVRNRTADREWRYQQCLARAAFPQDRDYCAVVRGG